MTPSLPARQNADIIEHFYAKWCESPASVDESWAAFFEGFQLGAAMPSKQTAKDDKTSAPSANEAAPSAAAVTSPASAPMTARTEEEISFFGKVVSLLYNFRALGHTQADFNPLVPEPPRNPRIQLEQFGLGESDMERLVWNSYFRHGERQTLREMLTKLHTIYCGKIGFEFAHIHDTPIRHWIRERVEDRIDLEFATPERQLDSLRWIMEAELFEQFLGKRFLGEKRFSNEGGEGLMVLLNAILHACPASGVKEIEMGMSHRGRMAVLANFVRKSIHTLLHEFTPDYEPSLVAGDGDVKYHLGYESIRELPDGKVRVSLAANPSHLEAVNSIVEGKARARQRVLNGDGAEIDRSSVLPLLLHGDAAFAGQGSVAEVLNLSQLPGYRTGGTIHIIINNQIGFTTVPEDARSSAYATDIAKMIEAPVMHVNGEDPMELYWAALFALEFRQKFARDVVLDLYCYRRQGHNETDQAAFTQPLIAREIANRVPLGEAYSRKLIAHGILTANDVQELEKAILEHLEQGHEKMLALRESGDRTAFTGSTGIEQPHYDHSPVPTGIPAVIVEKIGKALTEIPETFHIHPTLGKRFIPRRVDALTRSGLIDWALGEALAIGSLLLEGTPVRLSGQDVGRGTFSQRHLVLHDYESGEKYLPLTHIDPAQAKLCIHNSLLSEFAVLGFDYGYSLSYPQMLTMWEAQFGDFSNGAQVIIDQFISSAESKWQTPSDLVLLLPHGHEGMGPEHSSARLERYLQLCAEENLIVANASTPAQYFHILRRQKHRAFRKPLVLMTPKSLLGRAEAISPIEDFHEGACFQEILPDHECPAESAAVQRIIFCTGKIYYDLAAWRSEHKITHTAIIRIEQLYPFHRDMCAAIAMYHRHATRFVWCQEEPANMGAWSFIRPLLEDTLSSSIAYAGREAAASPAEGSKAAHYREQKSLLAHAFNL